MNRRQKIIVSVTGIFIVLLILIGLTYAYFLTRITGNGNPTSISITTANLELVYGDGTTAILTSSTPIEPGKFTSSKDFTVTNNGNALTDYAVTLEDFSITYANDTVIDGENVSAGTVTKLEYPSDMKMTITCTIESDDTTRNGTACGNVNGTLPTENSILLTNSIEVDDIHKYVLTLTYVDSGTDQSLDMNKTIKGKIDIIDPKSTIDLTGSVATYQTGDYVEINSTPIKSEIVDGKYKLIGVEPGEHTLYVKYKDASGNIQTRGSETLTIKKGDEASISGNVITFIDSSRVATVDITESFDLTIDETIEELITEVTWENAPEETLLYALRNNQPTGTEETIPGKETSSENEARIVSAEDDYGISYVYRGNVQNNYVTFSGMCWRIVRVQGDGKIKLALADRDNGCKTSEGFDANDKQSAFIVNPSEHTFEYLNYERNFEDIKDGLKYELSNIPALLRAWKDGGEYYYMNYNPYGLKTDEFEQKINTKNQEKLAQTNWCNDMSMSSIYGFGNDENDQTVYDKLLAKPDTWVTLAYFYSIDERLGSTASKNPTLKCGMEGMDDTKALKYQSNIGLLTADEMIFAGGANEANKNYYLFPNANEIQNYTMTPHFYGIDEGPILVCLESDGRLSKEECTSDAGEVTVRPSIVLRSDVTIETGGNGTQNNPYIIK